MGRLHFHRCGNFRDSYHQELRIFETDFGRMWMCIGIFFLFAVLPFVSSSYLLYIINTIGIYAIVAIGLNILTGTTGLISLGHGALFGVGAYSAAILTTKAGFPFLVAVPASGLITVAVGIIFGLPSTRLKHLYLIIATLAGQFIIEYVLMQWEGLTGGAMGIYVTNVSILGFDIISERAFFYIIYIFLVILTWIAVNLLRSSYGRAFIAIRDNEQAAVGMGINLFPYKLLSFAISSFYAGIAGALYTYYTMSITPEPFNLWLSIEFIAMIIIGGMGSVTGAVFGAIFITALNEILNNLVQVLMNIEAFSEFALTIAPLQGFIYGLAIVLFIIFEPMGLAQVWHRVRNSFRLWPFSY